MEWLDSMETGSVIYACLGSLCRLVPSQLIELGVEIPVRWGEEDKVGVLVKKDEVRKAVLTLMGGGGEESKSMRSRAIELGKQASKAMESGGSSNRNLSSLIEDIMKQQTQNQKG
ncbi:hypothetical protein OIU78_002936 [Salix suchowensis]|nr:hypothetical protein OIU78_002936 [Salix suchowensis]